MQTLVKGPINTGTNSAYCTAIVCLPPTIGVKRVAGHEKVVLGHGQINL